MFTGIIEEKGTIAAIVSGSPKCSIKIKCSKVLGLSGAASGAPGASKPEVPTGIGDSISVNGICLTVTELTSNSFTADVMPETLSRTSLFGLTPGSKVDLERAMPAYGRFGGHFVSGHIDGTGTIMDIREDGNAVWYRIKTPPEILALIVEKGSIAIDGISLTVAKVDSISFSVSVIPHTMDETVLPDKKPGDLVNLETDVLAKYTKKLLEGDFDDNGGTAGDGNKPASDRHLLDLI